MESQSKPIEMVRVSDEAQEFASRLVKIYDGDQVDGQCIEVAGFFMLPTSGSSLHVSCARLRASVAKAFDSATK